MSENAELWYYTGNERNTVENWLYNHNINYDINASTKELIELYRRIECGG